MNESDSDRDLICRVQASDDREAFAELVRRHQSAVRLFLRRLCQDDHAWADDLAQDTFILAHKLRHRVDASLSYRSWLFGLSHNLQRNSSRKEKLRTRGQELSDEAVSPSIAAPDTDALTHAIAQLSPEQQQVIHLHYLQQLPQHEVSHVLAMPLNTVKSHLSRAKASLRELLTPQPHV